MIPITAYRVRATRAASECFTVNPVDPTLSTEAGPDKFLGQAVTDSATLGGTATQPANPVINLTGTAGAAAGGTITFKLYGPSDTGCGDAGLHLSHGGGLRQRHLQQSSASVRADSTWQLSLGRRLQRQLAEHQRRDPQRCVH